MAEQIKRGGYTVTGVKGAGGRGKKKAWAKMNNYWGEIQRIRLKGRRKGPKISIKEFQ